ncbi:MAG: TlpA family protein disulfide reductase [Oscillospiraceae bacterium]|nr:TlpA family protein disulfide reductase [Oscillospiraceae bacterium]
MKNKKVIIAVSIILAISLITGGILTYQVFWANAEEADANELADTDYVINVADEADLDNDADDIDDTTETDEVADDRDLAPDFTVPLMTGGTFTLSEHRGTVVVLELWTTWCIHCVLKVPIIQELSEQFAGDAIFIGVNIGESPEVVQAFMDEHEITYLIGLDYDMSIHRDLYPSPGIPYMVVVDRNGARSATFVGGSPDAHALISAAVLEAMG